MDLYKEIIINILSKEKAEISFPNINIDINKIVSDKCYYALKSIKDILEDTSLDDKECFMKIEKIICVYEEIGMGVSFRHDF